MIPVVVYPYNLQPEYIGLSTDEKPNRANKGAIYFERDTELTFYWNGYKWIEQSRGIYTRNLLWNTESWEFELATYGSPSAALVAVDNFPAVISGAEIPISDSEADPTSKYKITDIDPTEGNQYFGYVDKDGAWYIMNLTVSAARYVKGDDHYIDAWEGRGGLNYDYFNNVF